MVELSLTFNEPKKEFFLTEAAAKHINDLTDAEGRVDQALLIRVTPGGCSGFIYNMGWTSIESNGFKIELEGATVIIPDADMRMITGSTLDFSISIEASKFDIINPNAQATCGCGKSFS